MQEKVREKVRMCEREKKRNTGGIVWENGHKKCDREREREYSMRIDEKQYRPIIMVDPIGLTQEQYVYFWRFLLLFSKKLWIE